MADQTAQELIKAAMRSIGVIATGETPTADEMQDGLEAMKIMFRNWATKPLKLYVSTIDSHALTAGTQSYTIGSGATINTARPQVIKEAYVQQGNIDYPIDIISEKDYIALAQKDIGFNYPSKLWYHPGYPSGTLYLWPPGGGTLKLHSYKQLTEPTALTTSVAFPGEYDAAIKWNLAEQLCPEYGKEPTPYIMKMAEDSLDDVINLNFSRDIPMAKTEILSLSRRWHVDSD